MNWMANAKTRVKLKTKRKQWGGAESNPRYSQSISSSTSSSSSSLQRRKKKKDSNSDPHPFVTHARNRDETGSRVDGGQQKQQQQLRPRNNNGFASSDLNMLEASQTQTNFLSLPDKDFSPPHKSAYRPIPVVTTGGAGAGGTIPSTNKPNVGARSNELNTQTQRQGQGHRQKQPQIQEQEQNQVVSFFNNGEKVRLDGSSCSSMTNTNQQHPHLKKSNPVSSSNDYDSSSDYSSILQDLFDGSLAVPNSNNTPT